MAALQATRRRRNQQDGVGERCSADRAGNVRRCDHLMGIGILSCRLQNVDKETALIAIFVEREQEATRDYQLR